MLSRLFGALRANTRFGRQASFDAAYYLCRYPDVGAAGANPYEHWVRFGKREGREGTLPRPAEGRSAPSVTSLIDAANLFDRAYYLASYKEFIGVGEEPLEHYLAVGQHRGYKPSAQFDPLVYLIHHPEAKTSPLLHYLQHRSLNGAGEDNASVAAALPDVERPSFEPYGIPTTDLLDRDLQASLDHSQRFGESQTINFTVDDLEYSLVSQSAEVFFAKIRNDEPFAYPRLPHGFWDCLMELRKVRDRVAGATPKALFSDEQLDRLAERLCDELLPGSGVYAENFLSEMLSGIGLEQSAPDYQRSVSFKWQPTIDDRVFSRTEDIGDVELQQMGIFSKYFKESVVHESMVWKRWAYSGDLKRLPPLARERPVVLMGRAWVGDLDERWGLPWFEHVEIPADSYTIRYAVLDRIKEAVVRANAVAAKNNTKRPLVLLQGGSFAYWLIARLHAWDPSVFYFDLGQTLHIWFIDNRRLWKHWLVFHPRLIMENCELDAFYRELGIVIQPPFAEP
jgi:hypothetical protein